MVSDQVSKDTSSESYVVKALLGQWKNLELHDGLLVRRYEDSDTNRTRRLTKLCNFT